MELKNGLFFLLLLNTGMVLTRILWKTGISIIMTPSYLDHRRLWMPLLMIYHACSEFLGGAYMWYISQHTPTQMMLDFPKTLMWLSKPLKHCLCYTFNSLQLIFDSLPLKWFSMEDILWSLLFLFLYQNIDILLNTVLSSIFVLWTEQ